MNIEQLYLKGVTDLIQVAPEYVHGVTNKTDEFQSKFFGKVPAFECGATALCDDSAIAHFVGNAQTRGGEKNADVICWSGFAEGNLLPAVAQWVWPTLGIVAPNKSHVSAAKENLSAAFGFMNGILAAQTFLVGERITYADITCALTLRSAYENVLTPEWRAAFPHVNRWFMTVINQPGVKSVVGDVTLCVKVSVKELIISIDINKTGRNTRFNVCHVLLTRICVNQISKLIPTFVQEAQFDAKKFAEVSGKSGDANKAKAAKKPAAKKEKKPAAAPVVEAAKEDKPKDPWGDCGKFTLDMDGWKRFYSNNDEDKSFEHFWTIITPEVKENYSLWYGAYKYSDELTMDFMAANLVGGMYQRIEKLRKHVRILRPEYLFLYNVMSRPLVHALSVVSPVT